MFRTRDPALSRNILPALLLATCSLCISFAPEYEFNKLMLLVGTWKMETKKGPIFEQWEKISNTHLAGKSYRLTENDTVMLETIQLVKRADGIFYIPVVENQNDRQPVPFRLVTGTADRFVFENQEHDFPQRIIYTIVTPDSVVARIEGISKGQPASSEFYYRRMTAN